MYLWSIDLEAVLVSMSCFSLLCEEADIRCGSDEMTANFILPNYHVYEVSWDFIGASYFRFIGEYILLSPSPSYAPRESGFSFRKPEATEISQNTPNCQFTVGISQVLSKLNIFIIKSLIKGAKVKIIVPGTGSSIYYASTRPGSSAKKDHGSAAENWFVQSGLLLGLILVFAT